MKKTAILILGIITVFVAFYAGRKVQNPANDLTNNIDVVTESKPEQIVDENIVQLPISDVEAIAKQRPDGLTKQDAEKLCATVLGDKADETGFPISYKCMSAVSCKGKLYYVMNITWLVNNHHWSYIGNCFVSFDGQEIYDGIVSAEEYKINELRWQK